MAEEVFENVWRTESRRQRKHFLTEELSCCPKNFWDALDWLSTRWEISIMEMGRFLLFSFFGLSFYWCGTREKFMHRPWGQKEIHSEIPNSCLKAKEHLVSVPWSSPCDPSAEQCSHQSQSHIICLGSTQYGSGFILLFFFYRKFTYLMVW